MAASTLCGQEDFIAKSGTKAILQVMAAGGNIFTTEQTLSNDLEDHMAVKHFNIESQFEFRDLLLVPSRTSFELLEFKEKRNIVMLAFSMDLSNDLDG